MRIIEHRVGRQYRNTLDRVAQIAEPAAALIERHMRGCVGRVEIAVTTSSGLQDMVADAHQQLFGVRSAKRTRWRRSPAGQTTLTVRGALVVINAQVLRGSRREIDKTVLHELTHAVQFARERDVIMRGELHNHGIKQLDDAEVRALNKRVDRDEREAERMERLHRQLAKNVA